MSIVKIGWLGDSQLDYMQYGMPRRRDDFIVAIESALHDMVVNHDIKHIIHTGDYLQSNRPSPFTMKKLQAVQRNLERNDAKVYVIAGNHDNARPHWVDILNAGNPKGFQMIDRTIVDADGVTIYGVPNMSREEFLKEEFKPANILVMHQAVKEFINFPSSNALDMAELPHTKYDVIAIGDIHIYRIEQIGKCLVGYAGATELNSKTEPDSKCWIELQFASEGGAYQLLGDTPWIPHRIWTRPVIRLEIKDAAELEQILESTKSEVERLGKQDPREPIMFIEYNSRIPNVIDRFRKLFDPDKFILRFEAVFQAEKNAQTPQTAKEKLSVLDLLRAEIPETGHLYGLAAQLFNPELDQENISGAVDHYIEERLANTNN